MGIQHSLKYRIIFFILPLLLSLAVYINSYKNQFVYDDQVIIVQNRLIKDWRNLPLLWSAEYFRVSGEISYRPLVTASYFLDYSIWRLSPKGYHLTNMALHGMNVALLYALALLIGANYLAALAAASVFATHPVLSEAVNAIGFREDLLAAFFYMASVLFFASASKSFSFSQGLFKPGRNLRVLYIFAIISFALALLSKEMAVTLPAVLLAFDMLILKSGRELRKFRNLKYHLPFIVMSFGYLFLRLIILKNPQEFKIDLPSATLPYIVLSWPELFFRYLTLIFWPTNLSADHFFGFLSDRQVLQVLSMGLILLLSIALVAFSGLKSRLYCIMGVWLFAGMVPVSNLYPLSNPIAERYLYLPFAGLAMMAGYTIHHCVDSLYRHQRRLMGHLIVFVLLPGLLFSYSALTYKRNLVWKDSLSLWIDTVQGSPRSYRGWSNLGVELKRRGMIDKAAMSYLQALSIRPGLHEVRYNLGNIFYERGIRDRAALEYTRALSANRDYYRAHFSLGVVLYGIGSYGGAASHFEASSRANPDFGAAALWLGASYALSGSLDKALSQFYHYSGAAPADERVQLNIASAMKDKGFIDRAALHYMIAVYLNPDFGSPYFGLGQTLAQRGYRDRAILSYVQALRMDPTNTLARESRNEAISK